MTFIVDIVGRQILDSRGNPTVEVEVLLENGAIGRAAVLPALLPVRMKPLNCVTTTKANIMGKGVLQAVANVNDKLPKNCRASMFLNKMRSTR